MALGSTSGNTIYTLRANALALRNIGLSVNAVYAETLSENLGADSVGNSS